VSGVALEPAAAPMEALALVGSGRATLRSVRKWADDCKACDLWERATQTVFGQGQVTARIMLVGEQPGDQEDRQGKPFVGPAGRVLDDALDAAGIDRETAFVTNVVKHFRWRPSPGGKRRLHERPSREQVGACLPWLESELRLVRPEVLVLMGATAAQALLGPGVRVTRDHGVPLESSLAPTVVATIHPSAVLRARDAGARQIAFDGLVADLRAVRERLGEPAQAPAPGLSRG
jgi:uracil-DNA glycosylase family protein